MSLDLGMSFQVLTLDGYSALGFKELFEYAEKVLETIQSVKVQFVFNGYFIVVNDNTVESAWEKYNNHKFEEVK